MLSGIGGIGFQHYDWNKHNAILSDLVRESWPVGYTYYGRPVALVYYIAYYLPAALDREDLGLACRQLRAGDLECSGADPDALLLSVAGEAATRLAGAARFPDFFRAGCRGLSCHALAAQHFVAGTIISGRVELLDQPRRLERMAVQQQREATLCRAQSSYRRMAAHFVAAIAIAGRETFAQRTFSVGPLRPLVAVYHDWSGAGAPGRHVA